MEVPVLDEGGERGGKEEEEGERREKGAGE
jgi:hypothetical protein